MWSLGKLRSRLGAGQPRRAREGRGELVMSKHARRRTHASQVAAAHASRIAAADAARFAAASLAALLTPDAERRKAPSSRQ